MTFGVWDVYWSSYARYANIFENPWQKPLYPSYEILTWELLLQGEALFQTHENLEHLAMMERVLGPLPQHMFKRVE